MTCRSRRRSLAVGAVAGVVVSVAAGCATVDVAEPPDDRSTEEIMAEAFAEPLSDPVETVSPDGGLRLIVGTITGGIPAYRLEHRADGAWEATLGTSTLGLVTDRGSLATDLDLVDVGSSDPWRDEFELPGGKSRRATVDGHRRTVRFEPVAPNGLALEVDLVVSDEGAAFRSTVARAAPSGGGTGTGDGELDTIRVEWERSGFHLDASSTGWFQRRSRAGPFGPAYESLSGTAREVGRLDSPTDAWNLPALVEDDERWILLAEAGAVREWPVARLGDAVLGSGEHAVTFPDAAEGLGIGDPRPSGRLPLTSPWRVVVTSDDLGRVVASNLVRHLAPPADDRDWSWVRPGRVSWSWWAEQDSPTDPDRLIEYVEFSAEMGWEYSLVDANWTDLPEGEIERVIDRANTLGVGILLWYNSGGPNNQVTEAPRDLMFDRPARRAEFARIAALGVAGVKVDFWHSDKPESVGRYLDLFADAADHELLVNVHGSTAPRGWSRTWPNLMTMESVAGGEQYLFNPSFASDAARHNTVLAFTRNVVGPMDATPGIVSTQYLRTVSNGHELASTVVFESALQHLVDTPEAYRAQSAEVLAALRDLPTAWDETVLLDGRPESHVVLARRHGDDWWVGAINGTDEPLAVDLDGELVDLVDPGTTFERLCDDPDDARAVVADRVEVGAGVGVTMLPAGGCLLRTT